MTIAFEHQLKMRRLYIGDEILPHHIYIYKFIISNGFLHNQPCTSWNVNKNGRQLRRHRALSVVHNAGVAYDLPWFPAPWPSEAWFLGSKMRSFGEHVHKFRKRWPWQNEHFLIYPKNILYYIGIFEAIYYSFIVLGCVKVKCIFGGFSIRVIWGKMIPIWRAGISQDWPTRHLQHVSFLATSEDFLHNQIWQSMLQNVWCFLACHWTSRWWEED